MLLSADTDVIGLLADPGEARGRFTFYHLSTDVLKGAAHPSALARSARANAANYRECA